MPARSRGPLGGPTRPRSVRDLRKTPWLEFKGEGFIAPPFTDVATAEMSEPFTFSGTFSYYPDGPSMPSVTETLTGSGIATVQLRKLVFGPGLAAASIFTTSTHSDDAGGARTTAPLPRSPR
jgi:hypothetical protein